MSLTEKSQYYRHSAEERADYIKRVLEATQINHIDIVASHSCGSYVSAQLFADKSSADIGSLAFLNPMPTDYIAATKPQYVLRNLVNGWASKYQPFVEKYGVKALELAGYPYTKNKIEDIVEACSTHFRTNRAQYVSNLNHIASAKVQLLVVVSDTDQFVTRNQTKNFLDILSVSSNQEFVYDKSGKLLQEGNERGRRKVLRMHGGGHFAYVKHSDIVNDEVTQLLKHVPSFNCQATATN